MLVCPACNFILYSSGRKAQHSLVPFIHTAMKYDIDKQELWLEIESTIQTAEIASHRQKNSKTLSTNGNIDHKWLLLIPF